MMRKFIFKSLPFVLPFLVAYLFNLHLGVRDKGDLLRIGNLINYNEGYRTIFNSQLLADTLYTNFSNQQRRSYTALTIGDSFSKQGNIGYQNFLSTNDSVSVLHFNESCNSIEMLHRFINGNVLDSLQVDYIIIQSVERDFVNRANNFDSTKVINFHQVIDRDKKAIAQQKLEKQLYEKPPRLFSISTLTFPIYNLLYALDDNAFFSKVYKVKTEKKLFSIENNELLFYKDDILNSESNNDFNQIKIANERLNTLSKKLIEKGIKLIVLISPDKYGIYYNYIKSSKKYPKPLFFNFWNTLPKQYLYIDTKEILSNSIKSKNDVYFYDDSHWSPIASKMLASKINEIIIQKHTNSQQ